MFTKGLSSLWKSELCGQIGANSRREGAAKRTKRAPKGAKTPREARPSLSAALRAKYKPKDGPASQVIYVGSDDEDGPPAIRYRECQVTYFC